MSRRQPSWPPLRPLIPHGVSDTVFHKISETDKKDYAKKILGNVDYDFVGTSVINLKDQIFNFEDVTLRDKKHKSIAILTGTLSHSEFKYGYWIYKLTQKIYLF